jgi:hypothetical protein
MKVVMKNDNEGNIKEEMRKDSSRDESSKK